MDSFNREANTAPVRPPVPSSMLWYGALFGALGGGGFGYWMGASLDQGGKFALFDKMAALRTLADQIGERWAFTLCCALTFALVGLVGAWRLRRSLVRLRRNEPGARSATRATRTDSLDGDI